MMLVVCKSGSSLLVTLVDRIAWCWSASDMRCLATREHLGEILVVGLPNLSQVESESRQ
jgi:hypothetical protein